MDVKIESSWKAALQAEFSQPYFAAIVDFLKTEKNKASIIYPSGNFIFNAFDKTPFDKVKVVVIGQDPYHGAGQAHGLCFSVQQGIKPPPSLVNIFKEIKNDYPDFEIPNHGNLESWAKQGVLLMNSILTVQANSPASHSQVGWQKFTDTVIKKISDEKTGIVFLLWGKFAQEKAALIDAQKHYILKAAHPSPFSAFNGFFGCKHFSKTNELLTQQGLSPINWALNF